jgi:hypothetical protein
MNLEIEQIEDLLRSMQPRSLSDGLKNRIDIAVHHAHTQDPLHQAISSTRPSPLPADLARRLEESLSRIPHPDTRKVVHFPALREQPAHPAWRKLAAVAAVALLGSASAFLIPNKPPGAPIAQTPPPARSAAVPTFNAESLVPAGYRRGLSEAKDEGIVWQPQYGPHRRLKLVYRELVTLRDASGRVYQVERPRVEYVLVPAKVD